MQSHSVMSCKEFTTSYSKAMQKLEKARVKTQFRWHGQKVNRKPLIQLNKIISCKDLKSKLGERDAAIRCRLALMHSGCRIDDAARRDNHVRGISVFKGSSDLFFCGLSVTVGRDHGLALGPEGRGGGKEITN